jgi:hypothetical protein
VVLVGLAVTVVSMVQPGEAGTQFGGASSHGFTRPS